jgi:hypothetical protein
MARLCGLGPFLEVSFSVDCSENAGREPFSGDLRAILFAELLRLQFRNLNRKFSWLSGNGQAMLSEIFGIELVWFLECKGNLCHLT